MAAKIRKTALQTIQAAGSGHIGGSFSIADILSVLYFEKMNVDPMRPDDPDRDRLVLSKGHCSPAMYATLALKGFFLKEHLSTFRKLDSDLSGHVEIHVPGVDMSSGSLGQGLSVALGMAMYAKARKKRYRTFCILGDGEIQEGQVWEAAMTASHYRLDHVIAFVDYNHLQIDGSIEEVIGNRNLAAKFQAFGWRTITVDGHSMEAVLGGIQEAKRSRGTPVCIILNTIKGKGVSFMENQAAWHGCAPTPEQAERALLELEGN